jgi:glycosyltransferase involved in cell wall biosynthesis
LSAEPSPARFAGFATQGHGSPDEERLLALVEGLPFDVWHFDRGMKATSALRIISSAHRARPDLIVMEGTGLAGGVGVMAARALTGVPYVVSSGDAIAPFWRLHSRIAGLFGGLYERLLLRAAAGYIGWSPYLSGRALTFGAPRAMTAANWAPAGVTSPDARLRMRRRLEISDDAVVFGLVGSITWSKTMKYAYGLELIRATRAVPVEAGCVVLIVGDGSGYDRLVQEAAEAVGSTVLLPGRVPRSEIPEYLAAMDVASLPQSVDGVGSFRYTTKLSEYLAAGLPVVTGRLPFAYDLGDGWVWRLPGSAPWDPRYVDALARLMTDTRIDEVRVRAGRIPPSHQLPFVEHRQRSAVRAFVSEIVEDARGDARCARG